MIFPQFFLYKFLSNLSVDCCRCAPACDVSCGLVPGLDPVELLCEGAHLLLRLVLHLSHLVLQLLQAVVEQHGLVLD
jgi:hypothetical protein